jgi:hypothetical protein
MFNDDPQVVPLVASILPLVALFQVFDSISAVTGGILRAQGRQVSIVHSLLPQKLYIYLTSAPNPPIREVIEIYVKCGSEIALDNSITLGGWT